MSPDPALPVRAGTDPPDEGPQGANPLGCQSVVVQTVSPMGTEPASLGSDSP